jgi:hypothetical protein
MDTVTVSIVTALAAGALAAAKDVATSAVKDSYSGLKSLIVDRYTHAGPFVEAVESDPASGPEQAVLANRLHGIESDTEAKTLAATLLDELQKLEHKPAAAAVFDFKKLRAAKNFELTDIEYAGTLLRADDASFEGDFKATNIRQAAVGSKSGN